MGIQAPLGFEDHLPDRMPVWRRIEETARKVAETYGYREMRTPMMESTDLFVRSVGEVTDIVEKEMFTFDKGEKDSLTLRPELTASFVRACVEHGLFKKKAFQKLFYIGANFRKERPQKGRLRQFHQFGVEALGATDPLLDAETVLLALRFFEELGVPGVKTKVNSIGCPNCRPKYRDALKAKFAPIIGQFCENCRRRFDRNVFRILDCKVEKDVALTADAPRVQDSLCADCLAHDKAFVEALTRAGAPFTQDPRLVRGFDYYTRTVYEFTAPGLGAQDAIGGGGRYDNLIEEMGGDKAGAVGFAIGLERVVIALEAAGKAPEEEWFSTRVFVTHIGPETRGPAFDLVRQLRADGIAADMDYEGRSLKAQMRSANRVKAPWVVIIGGDELAKGVVKLRDMGKSEEVEVAPASLAQRVGEKSAGFEASGPSAPSSNVPGTADSVITGKKLTFSKSSMAGLDPWEQIFGVLVGHLLETIGLHTKLLIAAIQGCSEDKFLQTFSFSQLQTVTMELASVVHEAWTAIIGDRFRIVRAMYKASLPQSSRNNFDLLEKYFADTDNNCTRIRNTLGFHFDGGGMIREWKQVGDEEPLSVLIPNDNGNIKFSAAYVARALAMLGTAKNEALAGSWDSLRKEILDKSGQVTDLLGGYFVVFLGKFEAKEENFTLKALSIENLKFPAFIGR